MSFVVIFLTILVVLFGLVFFTKRRFGTLGLALAAGATISALWVRDVTPIIAQAGVVVVTPPLESIVAAVLTLLPAILLLVSGPVYTTVWQRIVGALVFAVLAITLLLEPLGVALVLDGVGRQVYDTFVLYQSWIITAGLVIAILDLMLTKTIKHVSKH